MFSLVNKRFWRTAKVAIWPRGRKFGQLKCSNLFWSQLVCCNFHQFPRTIGGYSYQLALQRSPKLLRVNWNMSFGTFSSKTTFVLINIYISQATIHLISYYYNYHWRNLKQFLECFRRVNTSLKLFLLRYYRSGRQVTQQLTCLLLI